MKKREIGKQRIIDTARKMPPLYHTVPGEDFDYLKSRTLWWLVKQKSVLNFLWNLVQQSGAIKYNPKTHKWVGVDFKSEDDYDD